jgi:signal transduction histidine kinase/DNA-binding response OmpR family regulator
MHHNEKTRLEHLRAYHILDTEAEKQFDDLALLASALCGTPLSGIAFIDERRVWFKSRVGLDDIEIPRDKSLFESAIEKSGLTMIRDLLGEKHYRDNSLVVAGPKVRFYAGAPIATMGGEVLGVLCVMDMKPRALTGQQTIGLAMLAGQAMTHLETKRLLGEIRNELTESAEVAHSATKVRSSFLATMSHEIRTPLNAIIGMTDLMLGSELKAEQREYLETIRNSGETLLGIINDILDYSRIESGRLELSSKPLDLRACIENTLDQMSRKAGERRNEIVYVIDANVPNLIMGDETRLGQVLLGLLNNAIKFTEGGEVFLSVRKQAQTDEAVELMFSVKDTGIGIPKEKLESIFDAFTQADSSVTRKYGGAGLGLVLCARLVAMMGGKIWVESTPGKGSNFFFTIRTTAAAGGSVPAIKDQHVELKGKNVLIVDDNETNLQILSEECKRWGMIPRATASWSDALGYLRNGDPFDVAIYDMQMPGKDGIQLAIESRTIRDEQSLPIILLSSWDLNSDRVQRNEDLFAATVMKPLKMSQLFTLLRNVLTQERTSKAEKKKQAVAGHHLSAEIPLSIVVAEDNLINQKLIQRMLRAMGYEPTIVGTGLEVLGALERQKFDLVFMDVQMPEMDGLEATQKIRAKYGHDAGPRIIAMTAFAMSGDKEKCLDAGMNDYLSKPFVSEQVVAMIRKWGSASKPPAKNVEVPVEAGGEAIDGDIRKRLAQLEEETENAFVKELVGIFLEETPENSRTLKVAVETGDAKLVEQTAHKLKGASANLGANKLSRLFERLERMGREGAVSASGSLFSEIDSELLSLVGVLKTYVEAPGNGRT